VKACEIDCRIMRGAIALIAWPVRVKTNSRDELGCAVMPVMEAGMTIMFGMSSETIRRHALKRDDLIVRNDCCARLGCFTDC
jgi:hypothetical protein